MRTKIRLLVLPFMIVGTLATAAALRAADASNALQSPSGNWWVAASNESRLGYTAGFIDCYRFEYRGPLGFDAALAVYRDAVTEEYRRDSSTLREPAYQVLMSMGKRVPVPEHGRQEQVSTAPHGIFDGLYWMDLGMKSLVPQTSFVAGYLDCHARLSKNKGAVFSKSADYYRGQISQWYRWNRDSGDIDAERQTSPIAEALYQFRDESKASSK